HVLQFSPRAARTAASMLILAVISMVAPALFSLAHPREIREDTLSLSIGVAAILIVIYLLSLVFTLHTHSRVLAPAGKVAASDEAPDWTIRRALVVLVLSTLGVGLMSELLVTVAE